MCVCVCFFVCVHACVCMCVHAADSLLLYPVYHIHTQMSISVEGHILVFDEGHNMEDAAREAASYTLTNHDLLDVLADIDRVKELLGAVGEWVRRRGGEGRGGGKWKG